MSHENSLSEIVEINRYPLDNLHAAKGQQLLQECRQQLDHNGLCLLPDFINEDALGGMQMTANALTTEAHHTEHWRATPNGASDCPDSKLHVATRASMSSIGYDRLPADEPLRRLYSSAEFTAFVNALLTGPELYTTEDPLIGCMLTSMTEGDELGWHYDPNDVVVSLSIQDPQAGGEFEFAPHIRHPQPNARENEEAAVQGRYSPIVSKVLKPGTLSLFNGHRSLHRVAPVQGERLRIVALFNYSEVPYYRFDSQIHQRFFGRVAS